MQREKITQFMASVKDDFEHDNMFEIHQLKSNLRRLIVVVRVYRNMHAPDTSSTSILSTSDFDSQYDKNYNDKKSLNGLLYEVEEYFRNAVNHYDKTHKSEEVVFSIQYDDDDDDDDDEKPLIKKAKTNPNKKSVWNMFGL